MRDSEPITTQRRCDPERGQATVEFALILFPMLILVAGIIYFGIGLNYWLDMQRIANQGARWAAVNNWPPDCPRGAASCGSPNTLQESLTRQAIAGGLQSSVCVDVSFPTGSREGGEPVQVTLKAPFEFFWVTDVVPITLRADATMRLEQSQVASAGGLIDEGANTC